ncbi:MAG: class I SAM-dependent methyltransferase [Chloroflexota bacterium]|nr:class I SAM-dependent methyltransferase [Chloroflexota bacterium]
MASAPDDPRADRVAIPASLSLWLLRSGRGTLRLIARGVRAILGVDASPAMVAATQRQANTQGLPVVSIEGDAERLPVPDASYDLSMANHVLFLIAG